MHASIAGAGVNIIQRALTWAPARVANSAIARVGDATRWSSARRRRATEANAFWLTGAKDESEVRAYSRATFRNLAKCGADLLALAGRDSDAIRKHVTTSGFERLEHAAAGGRGVVVVTPHLGNFDLAGLYLGTTGLRIAAIAESINPRRDALFAKLRTGTGIHLIPTMVNAARAALTALRENRVLVVFGDRPLRSTRQLVVPFARGARAIPTGPAWLAIHARAAVLTAHLGWNPARESYELNIEPEICTDDLGSDPVHTLTMRVGGRLAAAAARYPDQWFVFDPDWREIAPSVTT